MLQLALSAVKLTYSKVLPGEYVKDEAFMERLMCLIFFKCSERRMLLEGIQDLLMVCRNDAAIKERRSMLLNWVEDPGSLLLKARAENTAVSREDYIQDLDSVLRSTFKRSDCTPESRPIHRERAILRYVVYMHLEIMNRKKSAVQVSPLKIYRNPETPVERSVRLRLEDQEIKGPSSLVVTQLSLTPSFFDADDRVRIRSGTTTTTPPVAVITPPPNTGSCDQFPPNA